MEIEVLITTNSIYSAGEKNRCNIWIVAFLKTKQAIRNKEEGRGEGRDRGSEGWGEVSRHEHERKGGEDEDKYEEEELESNDNVEMCERGSEITRVWKEISDSVSSPEGNQSYR